MVRNVTRQGGFHKQFLLDLPWHHPIPIAHYTLAMRRSMVYLKTTVLAILLLSVIGCSAKNDNQLVGERLNLPTSAAVNGIFFLDGTTGFVATASGEAYQTTDGGKVFTKLALDGGSPSDFYFLNDDIGFAFGRSGYLARTEDGGKSWNRIATDSAYDLRDIVFLDKGHGYAVGVANTHEGKGAGVVGESTDKGLTWNFQVTEHSGFWRLCAAPVNSVWILGADGITYSTDKGVSWEHNGNRGDTVRAMVFTDIIHGWSVGDRGVLRNSSDGGWSWKDQVRLGMRNLNCVASPDLDIVYLAGDRFLGMTINHGRMWLVDTLNYVTTFNDCQSVGKDVFFAGSGGTIIRLKR
jgi:photosystem II stability/assembly factor-like uncharacterized protein